MPLTDLDPILDAIAARRGADSRRLIVALAGAPGSGKSTQLPKICLEAGRGIGAMIAVLILMGLFLPTILETSNV